MAIIVDDTSAAVAAGQTETDRERRPEESLMLASYMMLLFGNLCEGMSDQDFHDVELLPELAKIEPLTPAAVG